MRTIAKQKQQKIKKTMIEIHGQRVPLYKIPSGWSGLDNPKPTDDDIEIESEDKTLREQKMAIQTYFDTGEIENSYLEDNIETIHPSYGESDLFDKYE